MADRHSLALQTIALDSPTLSSLAESLMLCALEAEKAGMSPETCPACLLVADQVMFVTSVDMLTRFGRDKLISSCKINSTYAHPGQLELH